VAIHVADVAAPAVLTVQRFKELGAVRVVKVEAAAVMEYVAPDHLVVVVVAMLLLVGRARLVIQVGAVQVTREAAQGAAAEPETTTPITLTLVVQVVAVLVYMAKAQTALALRDVITFAVVEVALVALKVAQLEVRKLAVLVEPMVVGAAVDILILEHRETVERAV
jgi:hypothetical protein